MPALLFTTFTLSGTIFHQEKIALAKGWPAQGFSAWLFLLGAMQTGCIVLAGPLIDRLGGRQLVCLFLLPVVCGLGLLSYVDGPWVAPVYLALLALSAGFDIPLQTKILLEIYGLEPLARVRAVVEGMRTLMTGIAPFVVGALIDRGIHLTAQTLGMAAFAMAASMLVLVFRARLWTQEHPRCPKGSCP